MAHTLRALLCAAALAWAGAAPAQTAQPPLPTIALNAGIHVIRAEVAQSQDERATGLMFRPVLAPNDGMLFAFEHADVQCFWMRNTLLPLSAAFIADDGRIVNIEDMKPQTEDQHCSSRPVRFVLEMNQGWFAKRGLKPGSKLQGAPFRNGAS